jgi:ATPase subunit of ABC transporter with duplicated ATPase domains
MYLKLGSHAEPLLASPNPKVYVRLPKKLTKAATKPASKKAIADDEGWIQKKKKRKPAKEKSGSKTKKAKAAKKKSEKKEIIELLEESSEEVDEQPIFNSAGKIAWEVDAVLGSDSEFELD